MAAKAIIEVSCGEFRGYFYTSRFGPAGKSTCIKLDKSENSPWMTPVEFEKKAGKGTQHNWKRTVRSVTHENKTMYKLIDAEIIKPCPNYVANVKDCKCRPCVLSRTGLNGGNKSPENKVPAKKTPPLKKVSSPTPKKVSSTSSSSLNIGGTEKREHSDSDSGISIEISTNTTSSSSITPPCAPPSPIILEPLTTEEQERPLPNYTLMVQEAIIALTKAEKPAKITAAENQNPGCSLLGIFLYILKQYPDTHDNVMVMNTKIRSTLALLKRMGMVKSINDEPDDLEVESSFLAKPNIELDEKIVKMKKPDPKQKLKSKSNAGSLSTTPIVASSDAPPSTVAAKKKASKNIVKKAKLFSQDKNSKNPVKLQQQVKSKKSTSKKVGSGKENSNKQPFSFATLKIKNLSPALAVICGGKTQMSRHEAVRGIWLYIKKHKLQDPNQKTIIICDDKLKAVTKKKKVTCSEVLTCLTQNMTAI